MATKQLIVWVVYFLYSALDHPSFLTFHPCSLEAGEIRWLEPRLSHIPPTQAYIVLVGNVRDAEGIADD
jgi:hypothetical protein